MSFFFGGGDKRRRKRSSDQAGKHVVPQGWASQSAVNIQNQPPVRPSVHRHAQSSSAGPSLAPPLPSPSPSGNRHPYPNAQHQHHANSSLNVPQHYQPKKVKSKMSLSRMNLVGRASQSVSNLQDTLTGRSSASTANLHQQHSHCFESTTNLISKTTAAMSSGAALCDIIQSKLNAVITSMDGEEFSGNEQDLMVYENHQTSPTSPLESSRALTLHPVTSRGVGSNHFSKVWLYANSRLPPHMPPFKVYMPTYPLICLAAQYSERAYTRPTPHEREAHVAANWRAGTKAMVLKSLPLDDMNTVVFAIRGSQTFMDWAVNFRPAPTSPTGFLDDPGNLCHAGFLYVAKQMIAPVASRLRTLLQENPSRSNCSLLITGHSAGGAVAALLYAHMMSSSPAAQSELSHLTGFFKRVHCITFGAPPVSLLPLKKPADRQRRKSLFYGFVNEGDPVARADRKVVGSLIRLYGAGAPVVVGGNIGGTGGGQSPYGTSNHGSAKWNSKHSKYFSGLGSAITLPKPNKHHNNGRPNSYPHHNHHHTHQLPTWPIPPSTLSTAGRIVVLRQRPGTSGEQNIEAVTVEDEQLREVVFGDPLMHGMRVYRERVEGLAVRAVTGGGR